jgi:hypothetical protein
VHAGKGYEPEPGSSPVLSFVKGHEPKPGYGAALFRLPVPRGRHVVLDLAGDDTSLAGGTAIQIDDHRPACHGSDLPFPRCPTSARARSLISTRVAPGGESPRGFWSGEQVQGLLHALASVRRSLSKTDRTAATPGATRESRAPGLRSSLLGLHLNPVAILDAQTSSGVGVHFHPGLPSLPRPGSRIAWRKGPALSGGDRQRLEEQERCPCQSHGLVVIAASVAEAAAKMVPISKARSADRP